MSYLFNSTPVRAFLQSFCAKARGGWFRHFSWNMGLIPFPIDRITEINRLEAVAPDQKYLDKEIGKIYGLTNIDLIAILSFHLEMTSDIQELDSNDQENEQLE